MRQKGTEGQEDNAIGRTLTEWRKPQYPFLKCNVDAAFFADTRSMGFGMVARDNEGKCIGCRTMVKEGLYEVKEGEAMGLREALSWIREMKFNQVIFEMDAQIIVKAVNSTKVDESEFGAIIEDCRSILKQEPSFSVIFISRLANGVAHALAKESRTYANPCHWSSPPNHISDIVTRDAIND
ncbi:uncharacterized protein [Primulina eburnea]|uniref:uncharacterized protein n=1 Tax=Primulina eburnea TaxID=1245227 RepID=UPI003C6C8BCA